MALVSHCKIIRTKKYELALSIGSILSQPRKSKELTSTFITELTATETVTEYAKIIITLLSHSSSKEPGGKYHLVGPAHWASPSGGNQNHQKC